MANRSFYTFSCQEKMSLLLQTLLHLYIFMMMDPFFGLNKKMSYIVSFKYLKIEPFLHLDPPALNISLIFSSYTLLQSSSLNFVDLKYNLFYPLLIQASYSNLKKDENGVLSTRTNCIPIFLSEGNIQVITNFSS